MVGIFTNKQFFIGDFIWFWKYRILKYTLWRILIVSYVGFFSDFRSISRISENGKNTVSINMYGVFHMYNDLNLCLILMSLLATEELVMTLIKENQYVTNDHFLQLQRYPGFNGYFPANLLKIYFFIHRIVL